MSKKRKYWAWLLILCMVIGLLPGNLMTVKAEEGGEDTTPKNALVAFEPDWDNQMVMPEKPDYRTSMNACVQGTIQTCYLAYLDANGTQTLISDLNSVSISAGITIEQYPVEENKEQIPGLYNIKFDTVGEWSISYTPDGGKAVSISGKVVENRINFYKGVSCTESFVRDKWGDFCWNDETDSELLEAYIKIAPNEEDSIADALYVREDVENTEYTVVDGSHVFNAKGLTIEKTDAENTYKITRTGIERNWESYRFAVFSTPDENSESYEMQSVCLQLDFHNTCEGLFVTGDFVNGETPELKEDAYWGKDLYGDISHVWGAFEIQNADLLNGVVKADQLKIYEATETDDGLEISTGESTQAYAKPLGDSNSDYTELVIENPGTYVVRYVPEGKEELAENYQIVVHVSLPMMGWYTKPEMKRSTYISDSISHGAKEGDNKVYFIIREMEDEYRLREDYKPVVICGDSVNQLSNSSLCEWKTYEGTVDGAQMVLEVTLKSKVRYDLAFEPVFDVYVWDDDKDPKDWVQKTDEDGTPISEPIRCSINVSYNGPDPIDQYDGDIVEYTGEDGTDWIGFSGCFISKEGYESGLTWFKGFYPEGISYWVHADTIQGVVDKLLAVAGKEMEFWKADGPVKKVIPNTGYIFLNMSYHDASFNETVQKEQYVYAPASIKGVLMSPAENPYQIKRMDVVTDPSNPTHMYMDENGKGDDFKLYDDVVEIPLSAGAISAGKGAAWKLDGTTDGETSKAIIHAIQLSMDGAMEKEFDSATLVQLKQKMQAAGGTWEDAWKLSDEGYQGPYLFQKAEYDSKTDTFSKTEEFYLLSQEDLGLNRWENPVDINHLDAVIQKPHRWPSLHVNASTQVRVQGLWTENNPTLTIGFYEGAGDVYTDAYDQRFTAEDVGTTKKVDFILGNGIYSVFDPEQGKDVDGSIDKSTVTVKIVKAESDTTISDSYSQGTDKAEIVVDEEAISDFVPLDEEDKKAIIDGSGLDVGLSISKIEDTASSEAVAAIAGSISPGTTTDYVNVDMEYKIKGNNGNGAAKKITETDEPVVISVPLNDSLKNKKNYYVYRHHEGEDGNNKVEKLEAWIDPETGNLCFVTDKFSVYAIAAENAQGGNTNNGSNSGSQPDGSGGSSSGSSTPAADTTTDNTKTETKPDGTKVETTTDTKADGTKVETSVETKTDGTKTETVVETAKDGSVKTTETVTRADGSAIKTEKETEINTKGKEVAITVTTEKDVNGQITGITQTSEIERISGSASATVTVEKTADGKITSAQAEVDKKGANSKQGVGATLFGSVVSQITEAAGTKSVEISMTVTAGKKEYIVKADAQDLEVGNKLKVMAIDEKTGSYVMVNAKTYTVNKSGSVKVVLPEGKTYQLMDTKEAAVVEKKIMNSVKVKKTSVTVEKGKKAAIQLSSKLDMDNVEKVTYSTSKKSIATVNKNGKVTTKQSGKVTIQAKVLLKNGKTKIVTMTVNVTKKK